MEQTFAENGQLGNLKKNVIPSRYLPEKLSDTDTGMYIFSKKKNSSVQNVIKTFFLLNVDIHLDLRTKLLAILKKF